MKRSIQIILSPAFLLLASCSHECPEEGGTADGGNGIFFRSHLPSLSQTRGDVLTDENLKECRVTCYNPNDNTLVDTDTGEITPYFSDCCFEKGSDGRFISDGQDNCDWPQTDDMLHFFAYSPSAEIMKKEIDEEKFNLKNYCIRDAETTVLDYRMENFRVAPDIADQVDFIAAYSSGTRQGDSNTGIELDFGHQLARIELSAWCGSDIYEIEIAGVRIGNGLVEGDFSFAPLASPSLNSGNWVNSKKGNIEHIYTEGESIVLLSKHVGSHATDKDACSLMGEAGPAMMIPMTEKIEAWEGKNDPEIDSEEYTTDRLYLSVLLRAKSMDDEIIYPYYNEREVFPSVYLCIGKDGNIARRVYKIDGYYYTSDEKNDEFKYTPDEAEDIHAFGWAALPVGAKWEAGKIYTYKLNYTSGIGWHDPSYPQPGEPILNGQIHVNVEVADWINGTDSNVTVPRK